ncbi:MAG: hypothetical protein DRJ65_02345 [Acidobacteria bacterium]|nr:MAG: hypothetical protein DRJ65_02345 [Acidobacteriota bacterium]
MDGLEAAQVDLRTMEKLYRFLWQTKAKIVFLLVGVIVQSGCGGSEGSVDQIIDDPAALDNIHLEIPELDTATWVNHFEPEKCSSGVNLVLYERRVPMLLDMNGRLIHYWPKLRAAGRAKLDQQGRLALLGVDNRLKVYDWHGELLWSWSPQVKEDLLHHDLIRLANGNYLLPLRSMKSGTDYLLEVNRKSEVVWQWRSLEHLQTDFPFYDRSSDDPVHINSVHELTSNQWYEAGDKRFQPGNILMSARHLDCIFIIDKETGNVVWTFREGLDRQHEARMIASGVNAGLIVVFNNRPRDLDTYRNSMIMMINPVTKAVVWEYTAPNFFSSVAGSQVTLPNGNLMIASSHGGRIFEIDLQGNVVWQFVPGFLPMRTERYEFDHCPQLAEINYDAPRPVMPKIDQPFIDQELRTFAIIGEVDTYVLHGARRAVVQINTGCRRVWVPADARIHVKYGIDPAKLFGRKLSGRFRATLKKETSDEIIQLVDDRVSSDSDDLWRVCNTELHDWGYEWAELCLSVDEVDGLLISARKERKSLRWENPIILIDKKKKNWQQNTDTKQISDHQEKQLKALGYIE